MEKKKEFNLEIIRGLAAISVVYFHTIIHKNYLDPNYALEGIFTFTPSGHLSVLIFFVVSGFVIGMVHNSAMTMSEIRNYIIKRTKRLYPIYFITVSIVIFFCAKYDLHTIICNYLFLQNTFSEVIWENNPIWSLNYEVLYYLLFIPISFFTLKVGKLILFCLLFGIVCTFIPQCHNITIAYSLGFVFWLTGLYIVRNVPKRSQKYEIGKYLSLIILFIIYDKLNSLNIEFSKLNLIPTINLPWYKQAIDITDLTFLPLSVLIILIFTNREIKYQKILEITVFAIPVPILLVLLIKGNLWNAENLKTLISGCFYLFSIVLWFVNFKRNFGKTKELGFQLGNISYAIYIIHFPILVLLSKINFFSGSLFTYLIRLITYITVVLVFSYLLEKKYQKFIVKLLQPKRNE
jgi:Predicted acyltransferases